MHADAMLPTDSDHSLSDACPSHDGEKGAGEVCEASQSSLRSVFVAVGAACIFFCTLGLSNSFGTFEEYYLTHQLSNQSPSAISWIGSLQSFLQFFAGMLGGPLFDHYGSLVKFIPSPYSPQLSPQLIHAPQVVYPSAVLFVFALMMLSLCTNYYEIMFVQGALLGSVMGFLQVPAIAAVSQCFDKKRAAALGAAVSGASIGGIVIPTILSKMLNASDLGFGWTTRITGFTLMPLMMFACLTVQPSLPPRKTKLFFWTAFKERRFVLLSISLFFVFFGSYTPFFYLPTFAVTQGMEASLAGSLLAITNATSVIGRIVPGILADRFGKLNTYAIGSVSTGVAVFCMITARTNAGLIVYAAFLGLAAGTNVSGASAAFSTCPKDLRDIGTYIGMGMAVAGLGALVGPPVNGAIIDTYGGYAAVCMISGGMSLLGGLIAFASKATTDQGLWGLV